MKLQFKHQKFQADAAKAVVDVFAGQPYLTPTYMMDRGTGIFQIGMNEEDDFTGWRNQPLVPELSKRMILEQIQEIQRIYQITPSQKLEGEGYNLTIEMETGVGKTYTYIKRLNNIYVMKEQNNLFQVCLMRFFHPGIPNQNSHCSLKYLVKDIVHRKFIILAGQALFSLYLILNCSINIQFTSHNRQTFILCNVFLMKSLLKLL